MANDLRRKIYHHLQNFHSLIDTHQVAKLLNTMTADVLTIQDFVSATVLSILVDSLTIAGMFALMLSPALGLCPDCCRTFSIASAVRLLRFKRLVKSHA